MNTPERAQRPVEINTDSPESAEDLMSVPQNEVERLGREIEITVLFSGFEGAMQNLTEYVRETEAIEPEKKEAGLKLAQEWVDWARNSVENADKLGLSVDDVAARILKATLQLGAIYGDANAIRQVSPSEVE